MKKYHLILNFVIFLFIFLILNPNISAVGIVHGDDTIVNFEPNLIKNISFTLRNIKSGTYLNLSILGDLAQYADISKINNLGNFTVTLKLPTKIEKPGSHEILISAEEIPNSTNGGTIMAVTAAKVPIIIKVPYPGKYIETELDINNVNINEPINFIISITNLGEQDIINAEAIIKIYNPENEIIETLSTEKKQIKTTTTEKLFARGSINKEGEYKAIATINYDGKITKIEKAFKVGTLLIEIISHTQKFQKNNINIFNIEIESKWNNKISDVYAEIIINKDKKQITLLKTPNIDINPWGKETIITYWDTQNLIIGDYNANITLYYADKTTENIIEIQIVEKLRKISLFTISYIFLAISIISIFWYFKKRNINQLTDY